MTHKAYAAYQKDADWIPLASIGATPQHTRGWIRETYISGKEKFQVVPISITVKRERKKTRRRKSR